MHSEMKLNQCKKLLGGSMKFIWEEVRSSIPRLLNKVLDLFCGFVQISGALLNVLSECVLLESKVSTYKIPN